MSPANRKIPDVDSGLRADRFDNNTAASKANPNVVTNANGSASLLEFPTAAADSIGSTIRGLPAIITDFSVVSP